MEELSRFVVECEVAALDDGFGSVEVVGHSYRCCRAWPGEEGLKIKGNVAREFGIHSCLLRANILDGGLVGQVFRVGGDGDEVVLQHALGLRGVAGEGDERMSFFLQAAGEVTDGGLNSGATFELVAGR